MLGFQATGMKSRLMTPILPELVLEILTYLSRCRNDLEDCCLVCRTWCRLAQPFIFSELSLFCDLDYYRWNRKFATYPHLAQYVTRLRLYGEIWGEADGVPSVEDHEGSMTSELLRRLPNIKYLKICDFFLPSSMEIEGLCHFTGLEWLEIQGAIFSQPAELLGLMSQLVGLKVLHIEDVEIRSNTSADLIGPTLHNHVDAVPKKLRNLKLRDPPEHLYILLLAFGKSL
ncbi:hypothetical protein EV421DRAFT_1941761 [Armillaria borealis]|uniref:F-box domain-containing protein n=1 Tax=Armillaria borealis TaxID=47425 RepID=A0AA39N1A1_9AGAR|nr:hypothetical protein EV421DRAFT_1941761 [Armillaria borealis]